MDFIRETTHKDHEDTLLILFTQFAIWSLDCSLVLAGLIKSAALIISFLGSRALNFSCESPLPPAWQTKRAIFLPVRSVLVIKVFIGEAGDDAQTGTPRIIKLYADGLNVYGFRGGLLCENIRLQHQKNLNIPRRFFSLLTCN